MPDWGQAKGMNAKGGNDEPKKRKREPEADGPMSQALQVLKEGFMPTVERAQAHKDYERDQDKKRKRDAKYQQDGD
jgi:hypothetical protein